MSNISQGKYLPGYRIGEYTLTAFCGGGGFGEVYLAESTVGGLQVALKLITCKEHGEKERDGLIKFQRCQHPNLIRILHVGIHEGCLYYTMDRADNAGTEQEYIADTLAGRIKKGKIPANKVYSLAEKMAKTLGCMHKSGLIHRDVKPDNIVFIKEEPVLADIGLVTKIDVDVSLAGTSGFMPYYVFNKSHEPCPESDFYALGMTLQCALAGSDNPRKAKDRNDSMTLAGHSGDLQRLCSKLDESNDFDKVSIHSETDFINCLYGKKQQESQTIDNKSVEIQDDITDQNTNQTGNYGSLRNVTVIFFLFAALYAYSMIKYVKTEGLGNLNTVQIVYMYFLSACLCLCPPIVLLYCRRVLRGNPEISKLTKSEMLKYAVLLGLFGGHRFRAGMNITGLLMLLSFGGLGLWWLTDIFLICFNCFIDNEKKLIIKK